MKRLRKILTSLAIFGSFGVVQSQVVVQNDSTFNTAHQMFLANELFESGEPFAEELGYNLDDLDPMSLNSPDSISYTTGIENYEYSRYLLNTLNGRSGLGLHMMWSPVITANAAMQPESFDGMFTGGMINGYNEDDMLMMMIGNFGMNANQQPPANAFPQFADFAEGNTHLPQTVADDFQMDYSSTRWNRDLMVKTLNLGAMGQSMLKQYFWASDMLGAFHDGDEGEVVPDGNNSPDSIGSPVFDPTNNIYYGGNNVDGFIGQVLTAVSINKTSLLINQLAYDGTNLGAVDPATYDPANGIQYFPAKIGVTETMVLDGLPPQASAFEVLDASSNLFDQFSFLQATVHYKGMMNPADNSDEAHLAYHEVFDGYPFPADMAATGTPGPFDLMTGTSKVIFLNLMAMHFNPTEGTFVDQSGLNTSGDPVLGNEISAANAAYTIVTLAKFVEVFDGTPLQGMANDALLAQANFILAHFVDSNGGFYNAFTLGSGEDNSTKTLGANAAIIRGLYAAYTSTGDAAYLDAANNGYNYLVNNYYVPTEKVFRTKYADNEALYTPWNLALLSGALREASLVGGQTDAPVIYSRVFKTVYNRMVLSEAEATGEAGSDSDGDGVPFIAGGNLPFVFAAEALYSITPTAIDVLTSQDFHIQAYPNPAREKASVQINLQKSSKVDILIYDVHGRLVVVENSQTLSSGTNRIALGLGDLQSGTYVLRIYVDHELMGIEKIVKL